MTDLATRNVDQFCKKIAAQTSKAGHEVVILGRMYSEGKAKLPHGQWLDALEKLNVSDRTVQRLMMIGAHPVLANPPHVADLPKEITTLEVLARVPKAQLAAAIEDGTVHPGMRKKAAQLLLDGPPVEAGAGDESSAAPVPAPVSDTPVSDGDGGVPATTVPETESRSSRSDAGQNLEEPPEEPSCSSAVGGPSCNCPPYQSEWEHCPIHGQPAAPPHAETDEPADPALAPRAGGRTVPNRRPPAPSTNGDEQYAYGRQIYDAVIALHEGVSTPHGVGALGVFLARHPDLAAGLHEASAHLRKNLEHIDAWSIS